MKKFLFFGFILFASLLALEGAHAQSWSNLSSGATNDLNNISCPDQDTCYVVGGAPFIGGPGVVLKTTNGGSSWTSQTIPTTNPLRGISCPTTTTCYAAGDDGTILKTTSGGTTWTLQGVPVLSTFPGQAKPWFWDIWATSESAAVAVGNVGAIYRTTNGGSTWTQVVAGAENQNLTGVFFVSSSTGWVIGSSLVLKTSNGGTSWSNQTPANSSFLWDAYSLDGITVWLSGGTVHKSTDGGASWSRLIGPEGTTYRGIHFVNAETGWIVGGAVRKTTSGGSTWLSETTATSVTLRDVECENAGLCYAVGDDGVILKYTVLATPANQPPAAPTSLSQHDNALPDHNVSPALSVGSTEDDRAITFRAVLSDPENDQNLRLEIEVQPVGTAFTNAATASFFPRPSGSHAIVTVANLANGSYHWQARVKDSADLASAWVSFGDNLESAADFIVAAGAPAPPTSLSQHDDALPNREVSVSLPVGSTEDDRAITFKAFLSDPDNDQNLKFEVEVKPVGTAFTAGGFFRFTPVASGSHGIVTVTDLANGSYHWQARAVDSAGLASSWISFGGNAESAADFTVNVATAPAADTTPPSVPTSLARTTPDTDITPTFTWTASTDNVGVTSYEICLDVATCANAGNVTTYTTSDLIIGSHSFSVKARDAAGNFSAAASITFTITTGGTAETVVPSADTTRPSTPGAIVVTSVASDTTPTFNWGPSTDNVGVTSYLVAIVNITAGGVSLFPTVDVGNVLTYTVPDTHPFERGVTYGLVVRAQDAAGNFSASRQLNIVVTTPAAGVDTTPPSAPSNPRRTSADSDTTPTFIWTASPSGDVASYYVDVSETTGGTNLFSRDVGNVLTYTLPDSAVLTPGSTTYIFHVRAKDAAGNISTPVTQTFMITRAAELPPPGEAEQVPEPEGEAETEEGVPPEEVPLPDLTFGTVTLTATNLRLEVTNDGEGDSGDFTLGLQWLNVGGEPLGAGVNISATSLRAGGRRAIAIRNAARNYVFRNVSGRATTLSITLDPQSQVQESDENNNVRTVARPLPDLIIRRITFVARSLRLELRNQGPNLADSFGIGLEWLDAEGATVGSERITTGRLAARGNRAILLTPTRATNATAGRGVLNTLFRASPLGAVRLKIVLDPVNEIAEGNDTNNETTASIPVSLLRRVPRPVQTLPDLSFDVRGPLTGVSTESSPTLTTTHLYFLIRNTGPVSASAFDVVAQWLKTDGSTTGASFTHQFFGMGGNGTREIVHSDNQPYVALDNYITAPPADAHRLRLRLSLLDGASESNTNNNTIEVTRPLPDLSFDVRGPLTGVSTESSPTLTTTHLYFLIRNTGPVSASAFDVVAQWLTSAGAAIGPNYILHFTGMGGSGTREIVHSDNAGVPAYAALDTYVVNPPTDARRLRLRLVLLNDAPEVSTSDNMVEINRP